MPTTWAEYLAAAKALTTDDVAGSAMVGANDVSAFLVDWYTRFITMGGQLTSGSKSDGTLRTNLDSPEAIAALQNMIDLLPYSPVGGRPATASRRRSTRSAPARSRCGPTWATIAGALYGPDSGSRTRSPSRRCPQTTATPAASAAAGAWASPRTCPRSARTAPGCILTQITSKAFEKYQVMTYQTDPNRTSTGADPEIDGGAAVHPGGRRGHRERPDPRDREHPRDLRDRRRSWRAQINLALTGAQDAATAMANAQAAVDSRSSSAAAT